MEPNNVDRREQGRETTTDAKEFVDRFLASDCYRSAYQKFLSDRPMSDLLEEDRQRRFQTTDFAANAMDFYSKTELAYLYDPESTPIPINKAIGVYVEHRDYMKKVAGEHMPVDEKKDVLSSLDTMAREYHDTAAGQLMKQRITPSLTLGREIVSMAYNQLRPPQRR